MIIKHDAKKQLVHQLRSFYGELSDYELFVIKHINDIVLEKLEYNFSHIANKYYECKSEVFFNPLHISQYTIYLHTISSEIYKQYPVMTDLCDKIYGILKIVSSADVFYEVKMPEIWFCDHPQSAIMGRANYANFFSFSQGCTVGNNKGKYPSFGEHVTMFSDSKIIGKCNINDHVILSANSYIIDTDVPSFSIVFGSSPNPTIHPISLEKFNSLTESIFKVV